MHICMLSTLCFRPANTLTAGHYICHWFTGKSAMLSGYYPTHNMKLQSILNKVTAAIFSRVTLIACSSQGSLSKCQQLWLPSTGAHTVRWNQNHKQQDTVLFGTCTEHTYLTVQPIHWTWWCPHNCWLWICILADLQKCDEASNVAVDIWARVLHSIANTSLSSKMHQMCELD